MNIADVAQFIALALLVLMAGWFSVVARTHFSAGSPRRVILFALESLSLGLVVGTILLTLTGPRPTLLWSVVAGLHAILAGWLFASALRATRWKNFGVVFGGTVPGVVVQTGPYKYIRHPLYLAYTLNWVGCAVLTGSILIAIGVLVIAAMYVHAAKAEERDLLRSNLGPAYAEYRKTTGLIVPRLKRQH
jgi:protein-S-isoprenylcysteine O-methyltransferase Ste14